MITAGTTTNGVLKTRNIFKTAYWVTPYHFRQNFPVVKTVVWYDEWSLSEFSRRPLIPGHDPQYQSFLSSFNRPSEDNTIMVATACANLKQTWRMVERLSLVLFAFSRLLIWRRVLIAKIICLFSAWMKRTPLGHTGESSAVFSVIRVHCKQFCLQGVYSSSPWIEPVETGIVLVL